MKIRLPIITALLALAGSNAQAELPPQANPFASTVVVTFDAKRVQSVAQQGFADPFTRRLVSADDPVRLASVSKLIVAMVVAELHHTGKLDARRDVSDYLGWRLRNPAFPDVPITLEMLLSHTSSITDGADYIIPLGEPLKPKFAQPLAWDSVNAPGRWFRYANLNYPVIASVLERATGERFDRLMDRVIFKPLRLDACFNWSTCSDQKTARAVVLTDENGKVRKDDLKGLRPPCLGINMVDDRCTLDAYQLGDNGGVFSPQGGARLSMNDLTKIGQKLLQMLKSRNGAFFRQSLEEPSGAMMAGESEGGFFCSYHFGLQIIGKAKSNDCFDQPFRDGRVRIGHAGEAFGLRSGLWLDPKTGRGVAFFTTAVSDATAKGPRSAFTDREELILQNLFLPQRKGRAANR